MSADRDITRIVRSWLHEDAHEDADRVLDVVLDQIDTTPQRRAIGWPAWRALNMSAPLRIAAAAVVVLLALVGVRLLTQNVGDNPNVTGSPSASADPSVMVVPGTANIFGAGHETAPQPGQGGGGTLPPVYELPAGATFVTFPSATGEVNALAGQLDFNGPAGLTGTRTDVESYGGISGLVHEDNLMFLVGVFLSDEEPADPAPPRLDFTDNEDFERLEPEIGQTFFIGDGVGRRYAVPPGATRLFLGFVNAYTRGDPPTLTRGQPGYYNNNLGELEVKVEVAIE